MAERLAHLIPVGEVPLCCGGGFGPGGVQRLIRGEPSHHATVLTQWTSSHTVAAISYPHSAGGSQVTGWGLGKAESM